MESPKDVVMNPIEQAKDGLTSSEIRRKALALDGKQVSNAIFRLKGDGMIEAVDDGCFPRYHAVKSSTGVEYCSKCQQLPNDCVCQPFSDEGVAAPDNIGQPQHPALKAIGELEDRLNQPEKQIDDLALKQKVLARLASILHPDIAAVLDDIAGDLS